MSAHTKEPWVVADGEAQEAFRAELSMDNCALTVIDVPSHGAAIHVWGKDQQTANERASRIVAAINACKRFSTELLEAAAACGGITADPTDDLLKCRKQRDDLVIAGKEALRVMDQFDVADTKFGREASAALTTAIAKVTP